MLTDSYEKEQRVKLTACYSVATRFSYEVVLYGTACTCYMYEQKIFAVKDVGMYAWVGIVVGLVESLSIRAGRTQYLCLALKWMKYCSTEVRYVLTTFVSPAKHVPSAEKLSFSGFSAQSIFPSNFSGHTLAYNMTQAICSRSHKVSRGPLVDKLEISIRKQVTRLRQYRNYRVYRSDQIRSDGSCPYLMAMPIFRIL